MPWSMESWRLVSAKAARGFVRPGSCRNNAEVRNDLHPDGCTEDPMGEEERDAQIASAEVQKCGSEVKPRVERSVDART